MAKKMKMGGNPNIVNLWPTTMLVKRYGHYQKVNPALLELFYQHRPSDKHACYGSEGGSDVWAHARSPDLVSWMRLPDNTGHMVCASTGAGITLPPGFKGPNGERWLAANLGSAPGGGARDSSVGRGLKLWTSNDSKLLNDFTEYLPPGTKTVDPVTKQNDVRPPHCCAPFSSLTVSAHRSIEHHGYQ